MEYTILTKVTILKVTNKCYTSTSVELGEHNENESIRKFIKRANKNMNNIIVDKI